MLVAQARKISTNIESGWLRRNHNFAITRNLDLKELREKDDSIFRIAVINNKNNSFRSGMVNIYGFETIGGQTPLPSKRSLEFWEILKKITGIT